MPGGEGSTHFFQNTETRYDVEPTLIPIYGMLHSSTLTLHRSLPAPRLSSCVLHPSILPSFVLHPSVPPLSSILPVSLHPLHSEQILILADPRSYMESYTEEVDPLGLDPTIVKPAKKKRGRKQKEEDEEVEQKNEGEKSGRKGKTGKTKPEEFLLVTENSLPKMDARDLPTPVIQNPSSNVGKIPNIPTPEPTEEVKTDAEDDYRPELEPVVVPLTEADSPKLEINLETEETLPLEECKLDYKSHYFSYPVPPVEFPKWTETPMKGKGERQR